MKLRPVIIGEDYEDNEPELQNAEDLRKIKERERIGSATSRYIDKTGQVNDIILETEESQSQGSPDNTGRQEVRKMKRDSKRKIKTQLVKFDDTAEKLHKSDFNEKTDLRI